MYSTVVESRPTSIVHPAPQPDVVQLPYHAYNAFKNEANPEDFINTAPRSPGSYAIPVKIDSNQIQDPTLANYETPNFIHKSEKQIGGPIVAPININQQVKTDIDSLVHSIDHVKTQNEKVKLLLNGKQRLNNEAKEISGVISHEIKELLYAKE
jgi:hypothetical protein